MHEVVKYHRDEEVESIARTVLALWIIERIESFESIEEMDIVITRRE